MSEARRVHRGHPIHDSAPGKVSHGKSWLRHTTKFCGWCFYVFTALRLAVPCHAQEVETRRWSHIPVGLNLVGVGYAYTDADVSDSPALRLEDVEASVHTTVARYIRTFELFEKSARIDIAQGYQKSRWKGLLDGKAASTDRAGWTDTMARFAVNVYGAPPLSGKAFGSYRANLEDETIVGMALAVHLPTGEYMEERIINIGSNRFTFRPQVGIVRSWGKWSTELTGSAWIYTDNDEFFDGNKLETDPLYVLQGHVWYTFRPGFWLGVGMGYGYGARSTVNGEEKDDRKGNLGWAISIAYPLSRDWGVKLGYVGIRRQESTGKDSDTVAFGISRAW